MTVLVGPACDDGRAMSGRRGEMTIDELAARVGMTVRNVRAYATRGLIAAPRLIGRKGYYNEDHAARLSLVRDLLDRGYTLNAVEKALAENPQVPESHALDLLTLLTRPIGGAVEPEESSVQALAELAGIEHDEDFVAALADRGLLVRVDPDTVRMLRPALVRAGAQAMRMGLGKERVLDLFDQAAAQLGHMAEAYVGAFRDDVWQRFLDEGMPEDQWPVLVSSIEALLPVVSQAVLASFRYELARSIEKVLAAELGQLTGEQAQRLFGEGGTPD
ncbi:DNA-binding transcriptional MerR regulator [Nocardioides zeae]|uniref:DNA-binding transcriptional MerR regulator n=3 Tax=Nocardioides zeae TaxID=1457234 RepID=A0ACC6ICH9_9ACTN|nr:DNA-binding transcriptional MerR regulator [Nocardioides zeae]MDR6175447.1 DNA-binding transcriptional MerR regulator [Nocardioides zeae]MDR6208379.1 DNA-binding transcriptional MerR regulator [Nocardioides zeae]